MLANEAGEFSSVRRIAFAIDVEFTGEFSLHVMHCFESGHHAFVLGEATDPNERAEGRCFRFRRGREFLYINRAIDDCAVHDFEAGGGSKFAQGFAAKIKTLKTEMR